MVKKYKQFPKIFEFVKKKKNIYTEDEWNSLTLKDQNNIVKENSH